MDGEIIERSSDVLGKSSRKRKESLVKKKKKNRVHLEGRMEAERGKGKRSFRENMWWAECEGPDLVGREYVYEVRVAHFRKFWSVY